MKKETILLIHSNQLIVNEISRIDVIVDSDHGEGVFRFLMKLLFVMKSEKLLNVQVVLLTYCATNTMEIYSRVVNSDDRIYDI